MQFTTLVSIATVLATLPSTVLGTGYDSSSSVTACETITATTDAYGAFATCIVLACLEIKPVTQHCGCTTIPTITIAQTACPTSCGATSYITAIEDCFPTSPPSSSSSSSTPTLTSSTTPVYTSTTSPPYNNPTSTTLPPYNTPSSTTTPQYTTSLPPVYPNSTITISGTITKTETHITTLTTCPASVKCTGQTVTYTSTEVCPTTTCTCVLPSVTYTTSVIPGANATTITTSQQGNTPPTPTTARTTFSQAGAAAGRGGYGKGGAGMGALGAFVFGFFGLV